MDKSFEIGKFDLDIVLRDAAQSTEPAHPANACKCQHRHRCHGCILCGAGAVRSCKGVFDEGGPKAKAKLVQVLSCQCDDFQRCLYYAVAGRGITLVLDDLEGLVDLLAPRCKISADLFRKDKWPIPLVNPVVYLDGARWSDPLAKRRFRGRPIMVSRSRPRRRATE